MDYPPLTMRQAQTVIDTPFAGWDQVTRDEARAVLDPALPYVGWEDPTDRDEAQDDSSARVIAIVLTSGAISTVVATVFALWVLA